MTTCITISLSLSKFDNDREGGGGSSCPRSRLAALPAAHLVSDGNDYVDSMRNHLIVFVQV
ncbi:hypothetical protein ACHAW5_004946 [Stephanodiscus triporus]|uniref:Uncharacterized protein n=1 Tax=Stephanodiscus triporus TaxID=2934178 RepID=A0ABD3P774_9STRA